MENVRVKYSIDQSAAVLAGKSRFGTVTADLDPSMLTEEQRAELVSCHRDTTDKWAYEITASINGTYNSSEEAPLWPKIAEPSDAAIVQILDARILIKKLRAEKAAAKAAEEAAEKARIRALDDEVAANPEACIVGAGVDMKLRSDLEDVRAYGNEDVTSNITALKKTVEDRVRAAKKALWEEQEAERKARWTALLETHGEPEQLDRFNAGCLPADERDELASNLIFNALLKDCPLYEKLCASDVEHENDYCEGDIKFRGRSLGTYDRESGHCTQSKLHTDVELNAEQWKSLMNVVGHLPPVDSLRINIGRGIVADSIEIDIRQHEAYCEECDAESERLGVRVTVRWNGASFEREFAL